MRPQLGVYQFGALVNRFDQNGDTRHLPGAPGRKLWLGLALGRAGQATFHNSGLQFRPQIMLLRQGGSSGISASSQWLRATIPSWLSRSALKATA